MRKRIASFLIAACLGVGLVLPVSAASYAYCSRRVDASSGEVNVILDAISKQSFSSSTSSGTARDYILHFINSTANYVQVPNAGSNRSTATDGTYTVNFKGSRGCYHYSEFIACAMYTDYKGRNYISEHPGNVTAAGLKSFLVQYAQAGEHIRISGTNEHSLTYISSDDLGFYTLQWYGDSRLPFLSYSTYDYFADILNAIGGSSWIYESDSATNSASHSVAPAISVPSAPANLSASKAGEKTANLSWSPSQNAYYYEVQYQSPGSGGWRADPDYRNSSATSYTTTGLGLYDSYNFRVRAVNSGGVSGWTEIVYNKASQQIPQQTPQQTPQPAAPQPAPQPQFGTVTISYNPNGGRGEIPNGSAIKDIEGTVYYSLTSQIPTRAGYTFLGWRFENDTAYDIDSPGAGIIFSTGVPYTSETFTYYAQWEIQAAEEIVLPNNYHARIGGYATEFENGKATMGGSISFDHPITEYGVYITDVTDSNNRIVIHEQSFKINAEPGEIELPTFDITYEGTFEMSGYVVTYGKKYNAWGITAYIYDR